MTTYNIYSWTDLSEMRDDLSGDYVLQVDLSSADDDYTGIGDNWESYYPGTGAVKAGTAFQGSFDGQGHTISDLVFSLGSGYYHGFIGFFAGTFVKDLILKDCDITGNSQVGLVGSYRGTGDITGCALVGGSITSGDRVGLVGWQDDSSGNLRNCYNDGCDITATNITGEAGGIIGQCRTDCQKCWSNAVVSASLAEGGVIGIDYNSLGVGEDCFWDTQTSGNATSDGGTGKTTSEMKDIDTYTDTATTGLDEAWDLVVYDDYVDETWFIEDGTDYPRLGYEWVVSASHMGVKVSGSIVQGVVKTKVSGSVISPPAYVKVGGSLVLL